MNSTQAKTWFIRKKQKAINFLETFALIFGITSGLGFAILLAAVISSLPIMIAIAFAVWLYKTFII